MMRRLIPLLAFTLIELTSPNGRHIWVVREGITAILPSSKGECAGTAKTKILAYGSILCVTESPEDVLAKFRAVPTIGKPD